MVEVEKMYDIIKEGKKVGVIQLEKYEESNMELIGVNTESIGISFNKLHEALTYIDKLGYKASYVTSGVKGYKLNNIEIKPLDTMQNIMDTFKNIYTSMLSFAVEVAYINNYDTRFIDIVEVFEESQKLLEQEKSNQYMYNKKIANDKLTIDEAFNIQDMTYNINKEVINNKFKSCYHIVSNSFDSLLLSLN